MDRVVVPNFKYAHYLPQRLKSILHQTYRPAEIIFLDDASEDNSVQVAREILSCGNIPFRIIENRQNQGVFRQWLRGIDESTSELIWVAEADDSCAPTLLDRLVDGFRHPGVVLSYAQSKMMDEHGAIVANDYLSYTRDIDADKWRSEYLRPGNLEIADSLIIKNTIPNASAVLFRKPSTEALRPVMQDLKHAGDWMFYLHILRDGWICFVPEPLNHHRRHNQSVTLGAKAINLFREILRVQMFWIGQMPIDAHTQSLIEMVRQSNYQRLSLHCGGYPDYCQHPDLADVLDAPLRRNAASRKARKSHITVPALAHAGT
jgi:glycosyltransferase involved in cell wall biosynthesis